MARRGFRLRRCHRRAPSDSPESLRLANTRQARRAVEDGQYNKAIQTLSSAGVTQAIDDVIAEMLAKHPQAGPPSIPSDPTPPHL